MFKSNTKFTTAACWVNSKIRDRQEHNTHDIIILFLLLVIIMVELLKVFKVVQLHFLKSLTVQMQFVLHPCDPFLITNRNMIDNSVEK